jgi:hypothetical protein
MFKKKCFSVFVYCQQLEGLLGKQWWSGTVEIKRTAHSSTLLSGVRQGFGAGKCSASYLH